MNNLFAVLSPIPKKRYVQTFITIVFLGNCLFLSQTSAASNSHPKNEESLSIIANHKLSSGNAVVERPVKKKMVRHVNFLLCENCFWCASQVYTSAISSEQEREEKRGTPLLQNDNCCPACNTENITFMPVKTDGIFNMGARKNEENED